MNMSISHTFPHSPWVSGVTNKIYISFIKVFFAYCHISIIIHPYPIIIHYQMVTIHLINQLMV